MDIYLIHVWVSDSFRQALVSYNEVIQQASENLDVVYGNIYLDLGINEHRMKSKYHPNGDGPSRK